MEIPIEVLLSHVGHSVEITAIWKDAPAVAPHRAPGGSSSNDTPVVTDNNTASRTTNAPGMMAADGVSRTARPHGAQSDEGSNANDQQRADESNQPTPNNNSSNKESAVRRYTVKGILLSVTHKTCVVMEARHDVPVQLSAPNGIPSLLHASTAPNVAATASRTPTTAAPPMAKTTVAFSTIASDRIRGIVDHTALTAQPLAAGNTSSSSSTEQRRRVTATGSSAASSSIGGSSTGAFPYEMAHQRRLRVPARQLARALIRRYLVEATAVAAANAAEARENREEHGGDDTEEPRTEKERVALKVLDPAVPTVEAAGVICGAERLADLEASMQSWDATVPTGVARFILELLAEAISLPTPTMHVRSAPLLRATERDVVSWTLRQAVGLIATEVAWLREARKPKKVSVRERAMVIVRDLVTHLSAIDVCAGALIAILGAILGGVGVSGSLNNPPSIAYSFTQEAFLVSIVAGAVGIIVGLFIASSSNEGPVHSKCVRWTRRIFTVIGLLAMAACMAFSIRGSTRSLKYESPKAHFYELVRHPTNTLCEYMKSAQCSGWSVPCSLSYGDNDSGCPKNNVCKFTGTDFRSDVPDAACGDGWERSIHNGVNPFVDLAIIVAVLLIVRPIALTLRLWYAQYRVMRLLESERREEEAAMRAEAEGAAQN